LFSGDLWAGAEQMIYALLAGLHRRNQYRLLAIALTQGTLSRRLAEIGVETYVIDDSTCSLPTVLMRAYRLLRRRNVRLIHTHRYKENIVGGLLGKLLGVNALMSTVHGLPEPTGTRTGWKLGLKDKLNWYVLGSWFSCVVAVSLELRKQLIETGKFDRCKMVVVHNGVSSVIPVNRGKSKERKMQIGTAGRLVAVKDLDLFIDVAADVLQKESNVQFRILGDGPLREQLADRVLRLGLADIVFEGYREDAHSFYDDIDIYLNTSLHEGLPLSVLEAMARGKPVIAPMVGGIPEVVLDGEEGFLIKSRDSKEFAAKCLALIRDRQLLEKMGNNGSRTVREKFSSDRMSSAYHELYEQILGHA
jgi:glycosyltransferase involved in cell wall biosynthesis